MILTRVFEGEQEEESIEICCCKGSTSDATARRFADDRDEFLQSSHRFDNKFLYTSKISAWLQGIQFAWVTICRFVVHKGDCYMFITYRELDSDHNKARFFKCIVSNHRTVTFSSTTEIDAAVEQHKNNVDLKPYIRVRFYARRVTHHVPLLVCLTRIIHEHVGHGEWGEKG